MYCPPTITDPLTTDFPASEARSTYHPLKKTRDDWPDKLFTNVTDLHQTKACDHTVRAKHSSAIRSKRQLCRCNI